MIKFDRTYGAKKNVSADDSNTDYWALKTHKECFDAVCFLVAQSLNFKDQKIDKTVVFKGKMKS